MNIEQRDKLLEKLSNSIQGQALRAWINELIETLKERDAQNWEDYLGDRKARNILKGMIFDLDNMTIKNEKRLNDYE